MTSRERVSSLAMQASRASWSGPDGDFRDGVVGEQFDEIFGEDKPVAALFLAQPEHFEIRYAERPRQETAGGVVIVELAPEREGGLLEEVVEVLREGVQAVDIIAD